MKSFWLIVITAFCGWLPLQAEGPPPVLQRGPYLQMANPTAMTVCWRTDVEGIGRVRYGTAPDALNGTAIAEFPAINHEVRLTGLTPSTHYYYAVDTNGITLAGGETLHFYTPPPDGDPAAVRFWVLGDSGTASLAAAQVRDALAPVHAQRRADFWLMLGDNAYYSGTDPQFQAAVFDMYPDYLKQLPLWACIGNHETYSGEDEEGLYNHEKIFVFPTNAECGGIASGTERYFSWNYGRVHFISLDSMTASREADGPMAQWLIQDLEANVQPWVVAFWHHPPYTKGSHDSDYEFELIEMRENILPILEDRGVDLVLSGHSHCYERSYLLDGHYGLSSTLTAAQRKNPGSGQEGADGAYFKADTGMAPNQGAVYITAGSSGQVSGGQLNHAAHFVSLNRLGSLVVDVSGTRMDVKFLRETAAPGAEPVFDDQFTIIKGQVPPPIPQLTRGPYLQKAAPGSVSLCWRTDHPSHGRVRYGLQAAALTGASEEPAGPVTEHTVRLSGLAPDTVYYYRVESNGQPVAGGPGCFFRTPAATGSRGAVRIWALGDAGTGTVDQLTARDAFTRLHNIKPVDVWLMLGDNAAATGTDAEYQSAVFNVYQPWIQQVPLWSCIGDRDAAGPAVAGRYPWDHLFDLPAAAECGGVASGTERYYSWDHANIHFVALDSTTSSRAADGLMAQWLAADLQANTLPWTIAFWHHPPYSKGSHDSDAEPECIQMRENIVPILEQYGVDLVLSGHSHSYERSFLLNGSYGPSNQFTAAQVLNNGDGREDGTGVYVKPATGPSPNKGTVYITAGSSGSTGGGPLAHPVHAVSLNQLGSVVIDVLDNRMDVRFLRETFNVALPARYDDYFAIVKGGPEKPLAPSGLSVLPVDGSSGVAYWQDNSTSEERFRLRLGAQGGQYLNLATVAPNTTGHLVTGLQPGGNYRMQVVASNIAGSASSNELFFTHPVNAPPVTSLEQWRFQNWGAITGHGDQADLADPDHDGSVNLLEYAMGTSPRDQRSHPALSAVINGEGKLAVTFARIAAPELTYTLELSSALTPAVWVPAFTSTGVENLAGPVTVNDPSAGPADRRFARLKVAME